MNRSVSIVIPSWNGLPLLRRNLPSVVKAAAEYGQRTSSPTEILVVDDGSSDETADAVPQEFPEVRLVRNPRNSGFAAACNLGFENARHQIIALLNNDVEIEPDYLLHQAVHFDDPEVFAVTARAFEADSCIFATGGKIGRFRRGFWGISFNYDVTQPEDEEWVRDRRLISMTAIGGFSSYDRNKLATLGGFNPLLAPFYWEDNEISYRAWKRGWIIRYEPRSLARHEISATIKTHSTQRRVERISQRNRLLTHWIHLHSPSFLWRHLGSVSLTALLRLITLDFNFLWALTDALRNLPEVARQRREEKLASVRSDAEIAALLSNFEKSAPIQIYYGRQQVIREHPGWPEARESRTM